MNTHQQRRVPTATECRTSVGRILAAKRGAMALIAASAVTLAGCGSIPARTVPVDAEPARGVPAAGDSTQQQAHRAFPDHLQSSNGDGRAVDAPGPDHLEQRPGPDHLE